MVRITLGSSESLFGGGKLEGPKEVVSFFEVGTAGNDFMDKIFNTDDAELAQGFLDDLVVDKGKSLVVQLSVASLVNHLADGALGQVSIGNVGLDAAEHVDGGSVEFDKTSVMDLAEAQELQDLLRLGCELVDTTRNGKN